MTIAVAANKWPYQVKEPIDSGVVLNYGIDWTDWVPAGSAIVTATWTIVGGSEEGSTIVHQIPDPADPTGVAMLDVAQTIVWLSVSPGSTQVQATVHIKLDALPVALEDERTLVLTVKER
jgi:hypothetical protein